MSQPHTLHRRIGEIFQENINRGLKLKPFYDQACQNDPKSLKYNLPLFMVNGDVSNRSEITNVDILCLRHGKVVLICEIEESDIKPNHVLGKLLSVIVAKFVKLPGYKNHRKLNDSFIFIHILSTDKTNNRLKDPDNSQKTDQFINVEKAVKRLTKSLNMKDYHVLIGANRAFCENGPLKERLENILRGI
jgi:hypothetical protein